MDSHNTECRQNRFCFIKIRIQYIIFIHPLKHIHKMPQIQIKLRDLLSAPASLLFSSTPEKYPAETSDASGKMHKVHDALIYRICFTFPLPFQHLAVTFFQSRFQFPARHHAPAFSPVKISSFTKTALNISRPRSTRLCASSTRNRYSSPFVFLRKEPSSDTHSGQTHNYNHR